MNNADLCNTQHTSQRLLRAKLHLREEYLKKGGGASANAD